MAFLTLVLKDAANRRTNAVVGAIAAVSAILSLFGLMGGSFGVGVTLLALVGSLVGLLIVWHAWKWPRSSEGTSPQQMQEATRHGA
jgi:divalent metal cation (Fe/Co/Zn/Cd) transporter